MRRLPPALTVVVVLSPPVAVSVWAWRLAVREYRRLIRNAEEATAYAVAELRGPW